MLAHMREDGDARDPREIEIQLTTRKPGGDSARGVTLADLLAEAAPLDEVTDAVRALPGRAAARVRVSSPHSLSDSRARRGVADGAAARHASRRTAGALLVRGLAEFGWDGAPVAKLRAAGTTYFESRVAYGVRWQGDDGLVEISSDQLFQMMFMVGPLAPAHCLMLALFIGVIPHDTSLHDLKDGPGRARVLANAHVANEPDADIEQLAAFLRMLALAARLDVPILVSGRRDRRGDAAARCFVVVSLMKPTPPPPPPPAIVLFAVGWPPASAMSAPPGAPTVAALPPVPPSAR